MLTVRVSTPNDRFECYFLDDENGRSVASINGPQTIETFRLASQMAVSPELFAALSVFADCCDANIGADEADEDWAKMRLLVKHYRAARDACAAASA